MVSKHTDIRCKQCNSLLAREERDGLCVRRGDLQLTVSGSQYAVSVSCYRCRTLNVVAHRAA